MDASDVIIIERTPGWAPWPLTAMAKALRVGDHLLTRLA
jgi:hypothetical protein